MSRYSRLATLSIIGSAGTAPAARGTARRRGSPFPPPILRNLRHRRDHLLEALTLQFLSLFDALQRLQAGLRPELLALGIPLHLLDI